MPQKETSHHAQSCYTYLCYLILDFCKEKTPPILADFFLIRLNYNFNWRRWSAARD